MLLDNFIFKGFLAIVFMKLADGVQVCQTPSGAAGHCIQFESCKPFMQMKQKGWYTNEDLSLIQNSRCNVLYNSGTICCPISSVNYVNTKFTSNTDLSTHRNTKLLDLQQCGINYLFSNKIVGGQSTEPLEFPWMVMLRTVSSDNRLYVICGGTLISNRYVLTAAHCLRSVQGNIKIHSVVLGEYDTNSNPDCIATDCLNPIEEILVQETIPHLNFSLDSGKNDIGLLRLRRNVQFSESIRPICLPVTRDAQNINFKNVIVTGWGGTGNEKSSNVLLQAKLGVTANSECSSIYQKTYYGRVEIDGNFLCCIGNQKDTCPGDSGGPAGFMADVGFGLQMVQVGIVSGGARHCGRNNGVPGLYTRVSSYVNWILDNMRN